MKIPRIYADFNNQNSSGFPRLNTIGSLESINRLPASLEAGQEVLLFEEEFEVIATIQFDANDDVWIGIPRWDTIKYFHGSSEAQN